MKKFVKSHLSINKSDRSRVNLVGEPGPSNSMPHVPKSIDFQKILRENHILKQSINNLLTENDYLRQTIDFSRLDPLAKVETSAKSTDQENRSKIDPIDSEVNRLKHDLSCQKEQGRKSIDNLLVDVDRLKSEKLQISQENLVQKAKIAQLQLELEDARLHIGFLETTCSNRVSPREFELKFQASQALVKELKVINDFGQFCPFTHFCSV